MGASGGLGQISLTLWWRIGSGYNVVPGKHLSEVWSPDLCPNDLAWHCPTEAHLYMLLYAAAEAQRAGERVTRSDLLLNLMQTLKIRTKKLEVVPLSLNAPQRILWGKITEKLDTGKPVWIIVLKARREGVSTLSEALMYSLSATQDLVHSLVTAHNFKASRRIWEMSKLFFNSSPFKSVGRIVGHQIVLGRSTLEVSTAGTEDSERSADLTCFHGSEVAFWPNPDALLATLQALPDDVPTLCILESTANGKVGQGELFYEEWRRAVAGESDFIPIFLPWFEMPDYRIKGGFVEEMDEEEKALVQQFELSQEQLAWRRWIIANKCQGDVDKFHQEYPATANEAFIQSGLPFFRSVELLPMEKNIRDGKKYRIEVDGQLLPDPKGPLEIWVDADPRHRYVIGADSSMGFEDAEHSRSAAEILDMDTVEQVAEYDCASAPHVFAKHLVGMGRRFNNGLLAPEVNASGGGGGRELLVYIRGMDYHNIHRWKQPDKVRRDAGTLYGWECLDLEARVLRADLQWIAARQIKVGDQVVGCHEVATGGKGSGIPIRLQTVLQRRVFEAPMVEVTLENGQQTRVSTTHPFLTYRQSRKDIGWRWRVATDIRPGDRVKCLPMWESLRTYEAGRLSGFLDGEGHLARATRRGGYQMLVTQAEGELAQEIRELWSTLGFTATFKWLRHKKRPHEQDIATSGVLRLTEVLRALGSLRPTRLLRKFSMMAERGMLTLRAFPSVAVTSVESIGDGLVVGLTTDPDHTLIADGIVGHNTNARTRPRMLARIREVVMERSATIHSKRLLSQLADFGENEAGGRYEALAGHDDLLFAYGIALMSRSENYFKPFASSVKPTPDMRDYGIIVKPSYDPATVLWDQVQKALHTRPRREKSWLEI